MAKALRKVDLSILANIVAETQNGSFMYTSEKEHSRLLEHGLVEINEQMQNDRNDVATRATESGFNKMNEEQPEQATQGSMFDSTPDEGQDEGQDTPEPAKAGNFELESGIAPPKVRRSGRGGTAYPFDQMEVGHSFHVPATEKRPEPAKALASTVSGATARYRIPAEDGATKLNRSGDTVPVMVDTRKFIIRAVGDEDPKGEGARVFRVQ